MHPENPEKATVEFRKVNRAYQVLSNRMFIVPAACFLHFSGFLKMDSIKFCDSNSKNKIRRNWGSGWVVVKMIRSRGGFTCNWSVSQEQAQQ